MKGSREKEFHILPSKRSRGILVILQPNDHQMWIKRHRHDKIKSKFL